MMSVPNSGSTWLAGVIARHLPGCRYAFEFFNPLRNEKHESILRRRFGCELVGCFENIVTPGDDDIDHDIAETWGSESYTFTKEVWSPCKLEAFVRHFRCFVLLRSEGESFPPSRLRVWSWYEHAWHALKAQGVLLRGVTVRERAREAHAYLTRRIRDDAEWLGVPVLMYEQLFAEKNAVRETLHRAVGFVSEAMVDEIVATRRQTPRQAVSAIAA